MKVMKVWFGLGMGLGLMGILGFIIVNMAAETRAVLLTGFVLLVGIGAFAIAWRFLSVYVEREERGTVAMMPPTQAQPSIIIVGGAGHPLPYTPPQQALPEASTVNWAPAAPPDVSRLFESLENES